MTICGRMFVLLLSFISFLILTGCSSDNGAAPNNNGPKNNVPASVEMQARLLSADLTAQGYEVTRGYFKLYTQDDCTDSYAQMKTCYANNPAAPYIVFGVRPWPGEFVDPATDMALGRFYPGYSGSFRLDPREAIVIFGILPPPAAYFGMQTYLFTREGTFDTTSPTYQYLAKNPALFDIFFTTVPLNQKRIQLIAGLSNNNNDIVVQQQSGAAFYQERFFVATPDQFMDSAVRQSLNRIGVSSTMIFTEPIPSVADNLAAVRTGLGEHADELVWIMRYAMPLDSGGPGSPSATWRKDLPLVILRVRDTRLSRPVQTYPPVVYETRTAVDEGSLGTDLTSLVAAVNRRWGQACASENCADQGTTKFVDLQQPPINLVGKSCMGIGMNCLGDTLDTTYLMSADQLSPDHGQVYAVVGTLATVTGNATYVGLSVNDTLLVEGVANVGSEQLIDTALGYADQVKSNIHNFYVYYFARNCSDIEAFTEGSCLTITEEMIPSCSDPAAGPCHNFKFALRNYIVPGTRRGPDTTLIQLPRLLKLTRK